MAIGMTFSFFESFAKLSKNDLHKVSQVIKKMRYSSDGLNIKKLQAGKTSLWRVRVGDGLRIIYSQGQKGYMLHYVDYRKDVYDWLRGHTIISDEDCSFAEVIPADEEKNIALEKLQSEPMPTPISPYGSRIAERLSHNNMPEQLIDQLRRIDSEAALYSFMANISPSFQELIYEAATRSTAPSPDKQGASRLIVLNDDEELERALKYPLQHWRLFLHPMQQEIVNQEPYKKLVVIGGPGTGKTIVLVHRAVRLSKEGKAVLFITKTKNLARILYELINMLFPSQRILVSYFPDGNEAPDYWVRGNEVGKLKSNSCAPYKLCLMLASEWKYNTADVQRIDHILFDEAQDLHNSLESKWIGELLKLNIGMTFSIDCNQTVYPAYPMEILNILNTGTITKHHLNYCYRSTKEILKYAKKLSEHAKNIHKIILSHKKDVPTKEIDTEIANLYYEKDQVARQRPQSLPKMAKKTKALREFGNAKKENLRTVESKIKALETDKKQQIATKKMEDQKINRMFSAMPLFSGYPLFYGLTGSLVTKVMSTEKDLGIDLYKRIEELKRNYDSKDIAILVPNEKNIQPVKNWIPEIETMTFKQSKGREWFAGLVLIDDSILRQNQLDRLPTYNSSNALYVAVTRFRQDLTVIALLGVNTFMLPVENIGNEARR